jgi:hypothetical protein
MALNTLSNPQQIWRTAKKRLNYLRTLFIFSIILLSFAPFTVASAGAPVHTLFVFEESGPLLDNPCDFEINYYAELRVVALLWYDEDGNLTKEVYNWAGSKDTVFTTANSLTLRRGGQISFTYISDTETIIKVTGNNWTATIPGYGIITGSVGMTEVREFYNPVTGEWESELIKQGGLTFDEPEVFCQYLQP